MILANYTKDYISAHKEFSDIFLSGFTPSIPEQEFLLFRENFINLIEKKYFFLLNTDYKFQLSLNLMQIAFKTWDRIEAKGNLNEYKKDLFSYFFISSCFLASKFDSVFKESDIKYIIYQDKYNIDILNKCQRAILEECHYKLYLHTPNSFLELVFKEFMHLKGMRNFKECISLWIKFALSKYEVFSKYDYPTIVFAACLITFVNDVVEDVNVTEEERDKIKNELMNYLRNQNAINKTTIENCGRDIIELYEKDEEESDKKKEKDDEEDEEETQEETSIGSPLSQLSSLSCIESLNGLIEKYINKSLNEDLYEEEEEDNYDEVQEISPLSDIVLLGKKRRFEED